MDIGKVRRELAQIGATVEDPAGGFLHTYAYAAKGITDPAWMITSYDIEPWLNYGGNYQVTFTGWLLVATSPDEAAQARLDKLISAGPDDTTETSIVLAVMAATKSNSAGSILNGAASSASITQVRVNRVLKVGGQHFYGADIRIRVEGRGIGQ